MIEWFAKNSVAANLLMMGIVMAGLITASRSIPVETFPSQESDTVTVSTSFRGATPKTTEEGITLRIEEAIADIEGIKEITSRSSEGSSSVNAEILRGYDSHNILDDIKARVDALNTLPQDAEKPIITLSSWNPVVIEVVLTGDVDTKTLRQTAVKFRESLLSTNQITNVQIQGVADYQMNIEVSPRTLDQYNLSLAQIGNAIRRGAVDISAGNVQTRNGDILIRSDGQAYNAAEFARIPIVSNSQGRPVTLGEIATIDDGFEEKSILTSFNGEPAVLIQVRRVGQQSALQVSAKTKEHMAEFEALLPSGVSIDYWQDDSEYLKTRINAVLSSAVQGGILVIILLSLFLRPAVAFWVFLGIPVSFMGAFLFMPFVNGSFNVISLFAFIMVIGIVVDDAIVTGENIYRKIREGLDPLEASIVGTKEITVPVTFGILTTVVAFFPLSQLAGTSLDFLGSQMPMVVIPVMLMSLVESKLVLPSHMSHIKLRKQDETLGRFSRLQQGISHGLERFVENHYRPFLERCLRNKAISLVTLLAVSSIIASATYFGVIHFQIFPRVESDTVRISLNMPESTGFETTDGHIKQIVQHFKTLQDKYTDPVTGQSVIKGVLSFSGSRGSTAKPNIGGVYASLQTSSERVIDVTSVQIAREVRELIGDIPGAQSLSVRALIFGSDAPINIELSGMATNLLYENVAVELKQKLTAYPGVFDIQDNYSGGKEELKLSLKPRAAALGLRLNDVANQVRNAVFGFQAQRIQRGRDELRVMVQYPLEDRSSIDDLMRLPIRVANGEEVLLSEVVNITPSESPSTLYRLDRRSIVNVTADVDKEKVNIPLVQADLDIFLQEVKQHHPELNYSYAGETKDNAETNQRLLVGLVIVLVSIYALLAIPFKSYGQPLIVMSIIPFSALAAILGHIITLQNLSMLSIFGMLALLGVVVNDSLVLVDYINKKRQAGFELYSAVVQAACTRFRPVLLTSLTTFAGLVPILLDGSQQAKWLKPMATSLAFGIIFSTIITLLIVPVNYIVARKLKHVCIDSYTKVSRWWLAFWNSENAKKT